MPQATIHQPFNKQSTSQQPLQIWNNDEQRTTEKPKVNGARHHSGKHGHWDREVCTKNAIKKHLKMNNSNGQSDQGTTRNQYVITVVTQHALHVISSTGKGPLRSRICFTPNKPQKAKNSLEMIFENIMKKCPNQPGIWTTRCSDSVRIRRWAVCKLDSLRHSHQRTQKSAIETLVKSHCTQKTGKKAGRKKTKNQNQCTQRMSAACWRNLYFTQKDITARQIDNSYKFTKKFQNNQNWCF